MQPCSGFTLDIGPTLASVLLSLVSAVAGAMVYHGARVIATTKQNGGKN